jgi:hypothetical protein
MGTRLRDRGGRDWIVRGPAYIDVEGGEYRAALVLSATAPGPDRARAVSATGAAGTS